MDNNKIINGINQLFHNKGIKQEARFDLLIELLEKNKIKKVDAKYKDINKNDIDTKKIQLFSGMDIDIKTDVS